MGKTSPGPNPLSRPIPFTSVLTTHFSIYPAQCLGRVGCCLGPAPRVTCLRTIENFTLCHCMVGPAKQSSSSWDELKQMTEESIVGSPRAEPIWDPSTQQPEDLATDLLSSVPRPTLVKVEPSTPLSIVEHG